MGEDFHERSPNRLIGCGSGRKKEGTFADGFSQASVYSGFGRKRGIGFSLRGSIKASGRKKCA